MSNQYSMSENMYSFVKEQKLCDVVLVAGIDGQKISAHRAVLCTASDFFYGLFTVNMKEKDSNEVVINDIDGKTLQSVVECIYTGRIDVNENNVRTLLAAASFFLFSHLVQKCTEFLTQSGAVNESNCVGINELAMKYSFAKLKEYLFGYIIRNFLKISKNDELNRMSKEGLVEVLKSDLLENDSEEDIFNALVKWVRFDLEKRKSEFLELVQLVRLNVLNPSFIFHDVVPICKEFECLDTFLQFNQMRYSITERNTETRRFSPLYDLIAIDCSESVIQIEKYCQKSKCWTNLDVNIPNNIGHFGAEFVDNRLIIIGGSRGNVKLNTVFSFDVITKVKRNLQPMLTQRDFLSTLLLDGFIYAIGGQGHLDDEKSVERYDIKNNKWITLASMQVKRRFLAVTSLLNKVFVAGGYSDDIYLNSVECYDPISNAWTSIAPMNTKRYGAKAVVLDGQLYVIGGHDGNRQLSSIERYDEQANEWVMMSVKLNVPRYAFGLTAIGDCFILAGGGGINESISSCEKLNLKTGKTEKYPELLHGMKYCHILECRK